MMHLFGTPLSPPRLRQPAPATPGAGVDVRAERIVFWTIALIPLWWILGLQVAVYPLVGWYLFWRSIRRPGIVTFPFGWNLWWTYIAVWASSLVVNLATGGAEMGRAATTSGSILGVWTLVVIVWYAMRRCGVRYEVVVRAICVLGLCQLIAVGVGESYLRATGKILETNSLIVTAVPSIPARVFFESYLYGYDELAWDEDPVPRLRSFYYWSPIAGTMSIFVCMAALAERHRLWKIAGLLGGLTTVYYAAARSGQVGVALALLIAFWLAGGWGRRILNWSLVPLAIGSPAIAAYLYSYFFEYRADSGAARLALYSETLKSFLNSPLWGYGTHGRSEILEVPLGSHSQVYSTLYHTGVLGSAILIAAWVAIAIALVQLGLKRPELAPAAGAWAGLTVAMFSGELEAASVTVFVLAAWLGCAWNKAQSSGPDWLPPELAAIEEPPTPWQAVRRWWAGIV
ncbi:O-antigen ligase family protein [Gloeobacter kilaueensis]|uniref:O-antigen ligase-related domain-containing protein n=1 Tax=Gloeobacter kilaueensis (strain ATCC BAA-2537 / CCAP 1431/1 / ULC 316 / JS1) TaxID=1183438 RepID=U5QCU4_GLOK1|nr:O-antigen ligase family protein [Gloeobacter kilaueensis]AGY56701.1 hypothetical protein GKIL_0455 [Gloeobacter kilaueensis JS1]